MPDNLIDWPRPHYRGPGGRPFLFYVVYGSFPQMPALDRAKYRSNGPVPGLQLSHYGRDKQPDVLDGFRQGYLWDELKRHDPALAEVVAAADECMILRGELEDRGDLNYLRDTVGLLTFLLDHGGVCVYDPWMFRWWQPAAWKELIFQSGGAVPRQHVIILTSEEQEDASLRWFHTRGMRKFGRPDLSVHGVPPPHHVAVIDLCNRFIEFQACGGIIEEGQAIRMKTLPGCMTCRHAGDVDDPDFNNVHVEITPPA